MSFLRPATSCDPDGDSSANEVFVMGGHTGTHIDAFCHFSHDWTIFGASDAAGGVDLVETGHGDPSIPLGIAMDDDHPLMLETIDRVVATCAGHGVAVGVNCRGIDDARGLMARGIRSVCYSAEVALVLRAYTEANTVRRALVTPR
ncbi:MAG: cyclase family protein [Chloroflexota bacterium]|nr:cyclase family protein [Chloroflexota bacterium]